MEKNKNKKELIIDWPSFNEYELSYIAFVDIFGFKQQVNNINDEKSFQNIWFLLYKIKQTKIYKEILKDIKINILAISDSLIISIPYKDKYSLYVLISLLMEFQKSLLLIEKKLIKGYVALGKVFFKDEILFGEGYQIAYKESEKKGQPPRIVIDDNIIKSGKEYISKNINNNDKTIFDLLKLDEIDNKYFIDYLKPYEIETNNLKFKDQKNEFYSVKNFINNKLEEFENNQNIYEKYKWLKKYYDNSKDQYNFLSD